MTSTKPIFLPFLPVAFLSILLYMILIVDDEALTRQLLCLLLHRAGYEVAEAVDGQDAPEQLRATRPRLIILDLLMPHLDGCANHSRSTS